MKRLADEQKATRVVVSGLTGSTSLTRGDDGEAIANPAKVVVACSGNKLRLYEWSASDSQASLILSIGENITLPADQVVTCELNVANSLSPHAAPVVRVQLRGGITGQESLVAPPATKERAPLFIHGWTLLSVTQSTPAAGQLNTLKGHLTFLFNYTAPRTNSRRSTMSH